MWLVHRHSPNKATTYDMSLYHINHYYSIILCNAFYDILLTILSTQVPKYPSTQVPYLRDRHPGFGVNRGPCDIAWLKTSSRLLSVDADLRP